MIKGSIIALAALRREDSEFLYNWINDPETVRLNAPFSPVHEPSHASWFESTTRDPSKIIFGIRNVDDLQLIGTVQLIDIHPVHRSAQLIIRIGSEKDRNRGAGSEAVKLAAEFAFRDRNLQRVWLMVFADNQRAIRAYEKAGLQREGTLRRACYINGCWHDEVVMGILGHLDRANEP